MRFARGAAASGCTPREEAGATVGDASAAARDIALSVQAGVARLPEERRLAVGLVLVGAFLQGCHRDARIPIGTLTSRLARAAQHSRRFSETTRVRHEILRRMLMAYADGELDLVAPPRSKRRWRRTPRSRVPSSGIASGRQDPHRLRRRARGTRSRGARSARRGSGGARVVELAAARAARRIAVGRWQLPAWTAIAASMLLGLLVGLLLFRGPSAPYEETGRGLHRARRTRRWARDRARSAPGRSNVHIGVSFRSRDGEFCRSFTYEHEAPVAGLACRHGEDWKIRVLAETSASSGEVRTAASMPMAVLKAVDASIAGEPLDAKAEEKARDAGWR